MITELINAFTDRIDTLKRLSYKSYLWNIEIEYLQYLINRLQN